MTDITTFISSVLVTVHSVTPIQKHVHSPDRLDSFVQEAYRIVRFAPDERLLSALPEKTSL
jgi:hypothetical protein